MSASRSADIDPQNNTGRLRTARPVYNRNNNSGIPPSRAVS
ncbi:MAG: hypothetical protein ACK5TO_04230 [Planctomycetaceae bacterium]